MVERKVKVTVLQLEIEHPKGWKPLQIVTELVDIVNVVTDDTDLRICGAVDVAEPVCRNCGTVLKYAGAQTWIDGTQGDVCWNTDEPHHPHGLAAAK